MSSLNKVILIGRVGKQPESRHLNNGSKVVSFSVATNESWKDKSSGERKERTEWHKVVVWNEHHANFVEQYVGKGNLVYVEGALQTRKWQDQSGNDRYMTEVVVQAFKGEVQLMEKGRGLGEEDGHDPAAYDPPPPRLRGAQLVESGVQRDLIDDDIPL